MINFKKIMSAFDIPSERQKANSIFNGGVDMYDLDFRLQQIDNKSEA
nr:hypothetical protein [uncultured Cohaesibacter sp.]